MNIRMLLFVSFFGWYTYSHIILTKDQWLTPSHWPMANHGPWFCLNLLRGPLLAPSHWKSGHSNQGPMVKPWSLILAEFPRGPLLAPSHWKPNQGPMVHTLPLTHAKPWSLILVEFAEAHCWRPPTENLIILTKDQWLNHGPWFWLNLLRGPLLAPSHWKPNQGPMVDTLPLTHAKPWSLILANLA